MKFILSLFCFVWAINAVAMPSINPPFEAVQTSVQTQSTMMADCHSQNEHTECGQCCTIAFLSNHMPQQVLCSIYIQPTSRLHYTNIFFQVPTPPPSV
jgi:hypothetical protein